MNKPISTLLITLIIITQLALSSSVVDAANNNPYPWWSVQSVDTMKFSRDPSREFLMYPERAKPVIEQQVKQVADVGATHIGIATPYDVEFMPILKQWVAEARKYNLNVWFRGNWSGWEGWFEYPKITRAQHLSKTKAFILDNPDLFEDGDIFTGCPECENGGNGDPRHNRDKKGHQQFLIDEFNVSTEAFREIDKSVQVNFNSMNGDVANLIMDPATTDALGDLVVVDHYVRTPEQLAADVEKYAKQSQAPVALGEFGAPIPDIHGNMTQAQQAEWLDKALTLLLKSSSLTGLNYWTGVGGSTALWSDSGAAKEAVAVLASYYKPAVARGKITTIEDTPIEDVTIQSLHKTTISQDDGTFGLPYIEKTGELKITKSGFKEKTVQFSELKDDEQIILVEEEISFFDKMRRFFLSLINKLRT